ncbi:hypothetical protein ACFQD2_01590 [Pseudomonas lini]
MKATEALARGLVREVALRDELHLKASALGQALGAKNPRTFAENKRWLNRSLRAALLQARDEHARHRALAQAEQ